MNALDGAARGARWVRRALREQHRGEGAGRLALARARRPVEEVRVRGGAVRGQGGAENGARVRVCGGGGKELGDRHPWQASGVPPRGTLITLEGLDGSGKSTLAAGLLAAFPALTLLREPGGVALAERVRALVTDPALAVDPRAEALLYAAARAQLVAEELRPRLEAGAPVLLDRFVDSSLAYQGAGRGLGVDEVRALNLFATGGLLPDLTLLLRVDPATGRSRQSGRGEGADRLEREPEAFFAAVGAAYEALAAAEPERFVVLDATAAPGVVLARAREAVAGVLTG